MNGAQVEADIGGLCLSVGAGRESKTSRIVPLKPSAAALTAALQALPGVYEGWFAFHRWSVGRKAPDWKSASGTIVDLDHHAHDPTGAKPKGIKAPPPSAWREKVLALIASGGLPGNVFHHTANGERVYLLFDQAVTDEATYRRAYHGACALVRSALQAAGVPLSVNAGDGLGYEVDPSVEDLAQWFWSPRAIVNGQKRNGVPIALREEPYSPVELAATAPPTADTTRRPAKNVANGARSRSAYPSLAAAREAFNRDHAVEWGSPGKGTCPICDHNDCFGSLKERPGKWFCFSEGHSGGGQRSERGWFGDALDVAAHEAGTSPENLLRAQGYLPEREEIGCNDGEDEEPPPPESENPKANGGGAPPHQSEDARAAKEAGPVFLPVDDFFATCGQRVEYILEPYLPKEGFIIVGGATKHGKTWFLGYLAGEIAASGRTVMVVEEEGPKETLRDRIEPFKRPGAKIHVSHRFGWKLDDERLLRALIEEVKAAKADVLILDVLNQLHTHRRQMGEVPAEVIQAIQRIIRETGCAVVLAAHTRKDHSYDKNSIEEAQSASLAGSHALAASADNIIAIKAVPSAERRPGEVRFYVENPDTRNGDPFPRRLAVIRPGPWREDSITFAEPDSPEAKILRELMPLIPENPCDAISVDNLRKAAEKGKTVVQSAVDFGVRTGQIVRRIKGGGIYRAKSAGQSEPSPSRSDGP